MPSYSFKLLKSVIFDGCFASDSSSLFSLFAWQLLAAMMVYVTCFAFSLLRLHTSALQVMPQTDNLFSVDNAARQLDEVQKHDHMK